MKKYIVFFLVSITLCILVILLSHGLVNKNQMDKASLFRLLVDNYCSGTGSYKSCEKFYSRYLSDIQKKDSLISCIYDTLMEVKTSKENYTIALRYYNNESYLNSYRYYSLVAESDYEHYKKSIQYMYVIENALVREVEGLAAKNRLDEAYGLLDKMCRYMDAPIGLDVKFQKYIDGGMKALVE